MGRSVASVRLPLNDLIAKIERAKSLMKKEEVIYADRIIESIKKRYSVCYLAFDSADKAALFAVAVELMRLIDHADSGCLSCKERSERVAEGEEGEEKVRQA
ncbi:hypothetical protein Asulf_01303 [Archaeoglobus sulfaticallidus PM70-1]|uniref:Uncharacterized protein n=1 Tax=Archaeoglobus sulfaticallidus PM70-1 TaxID=387631 RepID=N0BL77_9EURY|nr:hypothetical protein [Archaeoglobus sulfaticallidus]AGK61296.1 hypothetical protein Asulf_01303 [Archaeoglobus sulfaticallidus PM70-1]